MTDARGLLTFPRPLSSREEAVLRFMVSADDPRLDRLRQQAVVAKVSGTCSCGCATIFLTVDHDGAEPADDLCSPIAQTHNGLPLDPQAFRELILFLDHGWLSSLEIVYYAGPPPAEFPPPDAFETPQIRC